MGMHKSKIHRKIQLGNYDVDFTWVYILAGVLIVGGIAMLFICCCMDNSDGEDEAEEKEKAMMNKEMAPKDMEAAMEAIAPLAMAEPVVANGMEMQP